MTSLRQTAESRSGRRCKGAGERSSDSVPGRTGRPHRSRAVPACRNKQKQLNGQFMPGMVSDKWERHSTFMGGWQMERGVPPALKDKGTNRQERPKCRILAPTGSDLGVTLVLQVSHKVWWVRQAADPFWS